MTGKKWNRSGPPANTGSKKRFLGVAVNNVKPFPPHQPVERKGKGKNVQIDGGDVESAGPVNFVRDIRLNFFSRLSGIKDMHLATLPLQGAGELMHGDLAAAFKPRPG